MKNIKFYFSVMLPVLSICALFCMYTCSFVCVSMCDFHSEQRISSLLVAILIGLGITLSAVLNEVPMSVLYGVFLYMAVAGSAGIQFLERTVLFLVPVKHHPNMPYAKNVSPELH